MDDGIANQNAFTFFIKQLIMKHYTRFRAYQLKDEGSSMSLSVNDHFTLIEARYNDCNKDHILWELNNIGKQFIDVLHITSWDKDHCDYEELIQILEDLQPLMIEYPGYHPHTPTAEKCLALIKGYSIGRRISINPIIVNNSIKDSEPLKGRDVFYNPLTWFGKSNDESTIKLFRCGSFQILSLGDCESKEISERLMSYEILQNEVDVLILAHHGSVNSVVTKEFLDVIKPKVGICTVDYDNKFGHPDKKIVTWLNQDGIDYISTKTGDVIIQTVDNHHFKVSNYVSNNERKESVKVFENKTWYINDSY